MSETLRWILIAFTVVLLVGIYWWGRRGGQAAASEDSSARVRPEPRIQAHDAIEHDFEQEPTVDVETQALSAAYGSAPFSASREQGSDSFASEAPPVRDQWSDSQSIEPPPSSARRGRVEPTFAEDTAELPVDEPPSDSRAEHVEEIEERKSLAAVASEQAPTLSMSSTPAPRRIERRKIIALRLAAGPQRLEGARLRAALEKESLQHGKYDVFHRLHSDGVSIFSVASMVEPGTFDLAKMESTQYPGVTLFAQLPGPVPGMHALNELVACARSLHQSLGGTLQDERGVPLTVHRVERLRQEVREFERPPIGSASAHTAPAGN